MTGFTFNFHGVGEPARTLEPGEAPYWVSLERFSEWIARIVDHPLRERIRITFDDGNASDAEMAAPALRAAGMGATFFVLAGRLDRPGSLSSAQLRELAAEGFGVGAHGRDHVRWPDCDDARLRVELVEARDQIAEVLGQPVEEAAIPFGAYDRRVARALAAAGYRAAYSSDGGPTLTPVMPAPRLSVRREMEPARLLDELPRRLSRLSRLKTELRVRLKGVVASKDMP